MANEKRIGLDNLSPPPGSRQKPKRLGRGHGSGHGKTSGKGHKGQKSRTGVSIPAWFEGGQMPLYRRVPKRGFVPRNRVENQVVNLSDLQQLDASREIDVDYLREVGMVSGLDPKVKVLGSGELSGTFRLKVHGISASARRKVEELGGSVELVPYDRVRETPPTSNPAKSKSMKAPKSEAKAEAKKPAAETEADTD